MSQSYRSVNEISNHLVRLRSICWRPLSGKDKSLLVGVAKFITLFTTEYDMDRKVMVNSQDPCVIDNFS